MGYLLSLIRKLGAMLTLLLSCLLIFFIWWQSSFMVGVVGLLIGASIVLSVVFHQPLNCNLLFFGAALMALGGLFLRIGAVQRDWLRCHEDR